LFEYTEIHHRSSKFALGYLSNRGAQPHVGDIGVQSRVPNHEVFKTAELSRGSRILIAGLCRLPNANLRGTVANNLVRGKLRMAVPK
jgi:hypothetical protein